MLMFVVLGSAFTGYLLPWDQISYWAITISTSMLDNVPWVGTTIKGWVLGGTEPGPATLMNFYAIHTAILPILLLFALPFHFWRIRKANGIVVPRAPGEELPAPLPMVNTVPHLLSREAAVSFVVLAVILGISMMFNAPLAEQANPFIGKLDQAAPLLVRALAMFRNLHQGDHEDVASTLEALAYIDQYQDDFELSTVEQELVGALADAFHALAVATGVPSPLTTTKHRWATSSGK